MILRDTLSSVMRGSFAPPPPRPEVEREMLSQLTIRGSQAIVLTGVRRCGKSTLQTQLMRRTKSAFYCNFEDTRLFGLGPEDFPAILSVLDELAGFDQPLFLDEVQEIQEWQRLVRTLLDRGRAVCLTGSNASLLGRELGSKLTGRHLSFEVFPFSYAEYLVFTGKDRGVESFRAYLDDGGFPVYLRERLDPVLQELLRDVVQRDVAARHGLRETRHVMNLVLFLLANTGRPFSFQGLTKNLAVPTVGQTSRYLEYLQDAYLLFAVPKFSASFKQRVVAPSKYYAIDNGLRRASSPQTQPDLGHRIENAVGLHLRRAHRDLHYAGERDLWECDFVTREAAIQVCIELTPANRGRELRGAIEGARLPGKRRALVLTLDQADHLREDGVSIEVIPAWRWMT
ncbi:MAG TPA: ATP-binding protein [Candidatus Paceibacterota bacterium]|nr:ATP-binding protein [Verrucomicrobiota bacterium]HRZ45707.1 ATP-binding protein [Candidatus Paceibacterota bacterium]